MRFTPFLFLSTFALVSPAVVHAAAFEGTVRMKMTAGRGQSQEITLHVKNGFQRADIEAGRGHTISMITDVAKQQVLILMPEQKMYMVQPLHTMAAAAEKMNGGDDVTFEKTGETEKILGYTCTKYVAKTKDVTSDVWATEELGRFMGLGSSGNPMGRRRGQAQPPAWEKALMGKDFFPLRVVSRDSKGEQFRMEAVAVEKAAQPDSLFTPPADYRKFDLGGMMQGLGFPGKR
jgi:hypothetical protein